MPPHDDGPAIRPIPEEPSAAGLAPPHHGPGWGAWLAVALMIGALAGLLVGINIGAEPETPPTVTGTLAARPPDLAGPGFVEPPATTTTTRPPPTTTTTTLAEPEPPPTLGEMVPGLDGTMLVALPGDDEVWRWQIDRPSPERFGLPAFTQWADFDASAGWVAALSSSANPLRRGETLHLAGPDLVFQPFENGVTSFRWHPLTPGRLAWTRITLDGSVELWTGEFPGPAESIRRVAAFGEVDIGVAAWGDWGFALVAAGTEGRPDLITLGPGGEALAQETGIELWSASAGGTLLVARYGGDLTPAMWLVGPSLGDGERFESPVASPARWSADGVRLATVTSSGLGAVLQVTGEGSFQSVLDTEFAFLLAWTPGDRYLVSWASGVRTRFSADPGDPLTARETRRAALVFTDLADRSTSAIAVDRAVGAIAFRVAS